MDLILITYNWEGTTLWKFVCNQDGSSMICFMFLKASQLLGNLFVEEFLYNKTKAHLTESESWCRLIE